MAGDVGLNEQIIIHSPDSAEDVRGRAAAAGSAASGGVTHQYGPRVLVTAVSPETAEQIQREVPHAVVSTDPADLSADLTAALDEVGALGVAAFTLRRSDEYVEAKVQRPLAGEAWDSGAALAPDYFDTEADRAALAAQAGAPTSARLTGRVAVGIVIVEGPTADLKFSQTERTKVVAEVQNGLSWLGSQSSPAGIAWVYDIRIVSVNAQPNANDTTTEQKEARFRDPALAALGFGAGLAGAQAYIQGLRTSLGTDWAYCAFFTKYPVGWFAYATLGGPRLVMAYDNDGWGPDNIDRVFAHESGHIFGAPDEYRASNCNCTSKFGMFQVANANCEICASGGGVPCLMRANTWDMCAYTPYHLGFPQGQRYSGVFTAGTGAYGLWVNADWDHFVAKWQEWSNQGLRLDDLEISKPGGQVRYSGVFSQGTGSYGLWVNADWNSFIAKWQEWSNQGLRLADLEITEFGGQLRYSGVFRQGSGGYGLWVNADWNNFIAKWQEWSNQGLRLADFTITPIGGTNRYSGVFRQGAGGYGLWVNVDWTHFRSKWEEWSGQGLRLVDFDVTLTGVENATSPTAGAPLAAGESHGISASPPSALADGEIGVADSAGFGALYPAAESDAGRPEDTGAGMGMLIASREAGAAEDQSSGMGALSHADAAAPATGQGSRSSAEVTPPAGDTSGAGAAVLVGGNSSSSSSTDGGEPGYGGRRS